MAQKPPGLDEAISDQKIEAFTGGQPPVLEEPPAQRMWPTVVLSMTAVSVISVVIGMLIRDYVTVLQVLFVVACLISAVAAVYWFERSRPALGSVTDKFGVAVSPFELDEWTAATGICPDMCMIFEQWSRQRTLAPVLAKAKALGHTQIVLTWEPWTPAPVGVSAEAQGTAQPRWSNASIVRGDHDDYIDLIARELRDSGLEAVYLRFAHEMNGIWYPWHHDPAGYIAAWKYIRQRVRSIRGAWNVRMVWAPNPDLWRPIPADWLARLLPYWPGMAAVDYIGFTILERGMPATADYSVSAFAARTLLARQVFMRPIIAAEVNVVRELAVEWLDDMAHFVEGSHPYPVFVLSQGPSRAEAAGNAGDLSWSAMDYPDGCAAVARLVTALHGPTR